MRFLIILFPLIMALSTTASAQELSDYKWKSRIILLMNGESSRAKEQIALFKDIEKELTERDLVVFRYSNNKVLDIDGGITSLKPNSVPYQDYNGLLLLGKDGGVKLKKEFIVQPDEIFELIDSMPMRRAEMKSGN